MAIGCPKLDPQECWAKLGDILSAHRVRSITVVRMDVPCCNGIVNAVKKAVEASGKDVPVSVFTVYPDGEVKARSAFLLADGETGPGLCDVVTELAHPLRHRSVGGGVGYPAAPVRKRSLFDAHAQEHAADGPLGPEPDLVLLHLEGIRDVLGEEALGGDVVELGLGVQKLLQGGHVVVGIFRKYEQNIRVAVPGLPHDVAVEHVEKPLQGPVGIFPLDAGDVRV